MINSLTIFFRIMLFKLGFYSFYHILRPKLDVKKYLENIHSPHRNLILDELSKINDLPDYTIVEFGCGWGPNLNLISNNFGNRCIGFDISKSSIDVAREINSKIEFEVLNINSSRIECILQKINSKIIVIIDATLMYLSAKDVSAFITKIKNVNVKFIICVELVGNGSKNEDGYLHDYDKIFSKQKLGILKKLKLDNNSKDSKNWQRAGYCYVLEI